MSAEESYYLIYIERGLDQNEAVLARVLDEIKGSREGTRKGKEGGGKVTLSGAVGTYWRTTAAAIQSLIRSHPNARMSVVVVGEFYQTQMSRPIDAPI